jgi:hypothetical protein
MALLAKAVAPAIKVRGLRADCFVMHHGDAAQALRITRRSQHRFSAAAPIANRGASEGIWSGWAGAICTRFLGQRS